MNDLFLFRDGEGQHSQNIATQGYGASYTMPMFSNGTFFGFVFFNSYESDVFTEESLHYLDLFGHLIALVVINEVSAIRTLLAAVRTAREMTSQRDAETGAHVDRMSHYARIIARDLAPQFDFSDEYIEHVFMYAPLHDIGKLAVPDAILLKPAKLTAEEFEVMKTHVTRGRHMVDEMLKSFGLDSFQHVDILRNIVHYHHETLDGLGYPEGLSGDDIPIEARIIAVADIFDALTSCRPYKRAWSNEEAFDTLRKLAGRSLDAQCVEAMQRHEEDLLKIQARFQEDQFG